MSSWDEEKTLLLKELNEAHDHLSAVLNSPRIWRRVHLASQRAIEQVDDARKQLAEQAHPV